MAKTGIEIPEAPYPHDGSHEVASVAPDLGSTAMKELTPGQAARRNAIIMSRNAFPGARKSNRPPKRIAPGSAQYRY